MRILIDQFQGMASRPDPAEVGSRFSRNIVFGPGGTWIETRPGTEQLTTETRPQAQPEGAVFPAEPEFASAYRLKDDRIDPIILVQATRDNTSIPRENFAPRLVCPVVFMPLSVVGFGADTPTPPAPDVWFVGTTISATTGLALTAVDITMTPSGGGSPINFQSDGSGNFSQQVPSANYTVAATKTGYINWVEVIDLTVPLTIEKVIALAQVGDPASITLTWGDAPRDLDLHLRGPSVSGGEFHVYWNDRDSLGNASLDIDKTTGFGPETITIEALVAGTYRVFIHDYSNRASNPSTGFVGSEAQVRITFANGSQVVYNAPQEAGTQWHVANIDGITGALTAIGAMSYQSFAPDVGT